MWPLYRVHALLFVSAYVGFLGYAAITDPDDPVVALFKENTPTEEPPLVAAPALPVTSTRVVENVSVAENDVSAPASEDTEQQQERVRLSELSQQAAKAEAPEERAEAIDQLSAATPETLQALQAVVTSDSAVRNRIRALNSLRALAQRDDAKEAVLPIVQLATTDTNIGVASRAAEVYRELAEDPAASD